MTLHEGHKPNLYGLIVGILLLLAACTLAVPALSSTISNIPLDHRINSYVDELGRRGLLEGLFFSEKPYAREDVCAAIAKLEKTVETGQVQLSPYEAWLVGRLKEEFRFVIQGLPAGESAAELGADLEVSAVSTKNDVTQEDELGEEETLAEKEEFLRALGFGWIEVSMPYGLGLSHRFRVDTRADRDAGFLGRPWREDTGGYVAAGYGRLKLGPLEALLGRDKLSWGPGKSGSLILSGLAPAFDMMKVSFNFGRVTATGFFTRLDDMELSTPVFYAGDTLAAGEVVERYLSGHRIDVRVTRTLEIGLSETVVYGGPDRDFDLGYINPLNFFYAHQWNLEKNDNPIWCLDASWWPSQRLQVYGQLVVDDYQFEQKDERDKEPAEVGFLVGAHGGDPFGLNGVSVTVEYARVNPWTYNQPLPWNRYEYGDALLGHPLGPDADAFYVSVGKWFSKDFSAELDYRFVRHGETSIDTAWPVPIAGPWGEASFPEGFPLGVDSKSHRMGLAVRFHPTRALDMEGLVAVESVTDYANEAGAKSEVFEAGFKVSFRPDWVLGIGD